MVLHDSIFVRQDNITTIRTNNLDVFLNSLMHLVFDDNVDETMQETLIGYIGVKYPFSFLLG